MFNPEATHWYTRQGEPLHTVKDQQGNDRPTDLRDARKLDLLPSVTNVLGIIAKPTLTAWQLENAVMAALTLPRREGEDADTFAKRVAEDSKSRVREAAEFGTLLHAGAERVANNPLDLDPREALYPWLAQYRDWFIANCERLLWTERTVVSNEEGYAGTADLCMIHRTLGLTLVDIKTQTIKPKRLPRVYPTWLYQLAAYRHALKGPYALVNLIVNASEPEPPVEHRWGPDSVAEGWEVFRAAHLIWRNEKGYNPIKLAEIPDHGTTGPQDCGETGDRGKG